MTTKINVSKLVKRPVPAGHKMKYQHFYTTPEGESLARTAYGTWKIRATDATYNGPRRLHSTHAWLETENGLLAASAAALCNPKDTPVKKLGVAIAHNRCIKQFESLNHAVN
jgi:hypothetical protein